MQIVDKNVNGDKTYSFKEMDLDLALTIVDDYGKVAAEKDYAGIIEPPFAVLLDFDVAR